MAEQQPQPPVPVDDRPKWTPREELDRLAQQQRDAKAQQAMTEALQRTSEDRRSQGRFQVELSSELLKAVKDVTELAAALPPNQVGLRILDSLWGHAQESADRSTDPAVKSFYQVYARTIGALLEDFKPRLNKPTSD